MGAGILRNIRSQISNAVSGDGKRYRRRDRKCGEGDGADVYDLPGAGAGYMLRIDCWEAEKNLKTTPGSDCALNTLAIDEPLEYARLYLDGNMQMWVDAEDSLEL